MNWQSEVQCGLFLALQFHSCLMNICKYPEIFITELGGLIHGLEIAYHTYGKLNVDGNNTV